MILFVLRNFETLIKGKKQLVETEINMDYCERVKTLYENRKFTDITLTFPGSVITYDAHRLILAISSPVFERILHGPMRTEGPNVLRHDDNPLVMKYVIAHCYGEDIHPMDMDTALELYKLADKYLLDELKRDCGSYIIYGTEDNRMRGISEENPCGYLVDDVPCFPLMH